MKMARAALGWSVKDLSDASGASATTIKRIEEVDGVANTSRLATLQAVHDAFVATGRVQFEGEFTVRFVPSG